MGKFFFNADGSIRSSQTVAQQFPFFGDSRPVMFWAERGLVRFEDTRDDVPTDKKTGAMSWQDAAERVLALSGMVIRSSEDRRWAHERQRLQQFICEMESVIAQAKDQGSPFDPGVVSELARRRKKSQVVVNPTVVDFFE